MPESENRGQGTCLNVPLHIVLSIAGHGPGDPWALPGDLGNLQYQATLHPWALALNLGSPEQ